MGDIKPWQAVLFVVALLVLGGSIAWNVLGGKRVDLTDKVLMADVETGDRFWFDVSGRAAAMYPEKHPDTGRYTLLPIEEHGDGQWRILPRAMEDFKSIEGETPAVTDPGEGIVRVTDQSPRTTRPSS